VVDGLGILLAAFSFPNSLLAALTHVSFELLFHHGFDAAPAVAPRRISWTGDASTMMRSMTHV
jgi:hypothetical protein